jgi:hypothetical protein
MEKRLVKLFGRIQVVFLDVIAQKLCGVSHQRYGSHLASLSQKPKLGRWIQTYVPDREINQLLNAGPSVVKDAQQNCISSTLWLAEVWLCQDLCQLVF